MKLVVFSVYDEKACFYGVPFYAKTDGEAIRMFSAAVQDTGSSIGMFPGDFSLYRIGFFDDGSGSLEAVTPLFLSRGSEHVKPVLKSLETTVISE